LSRRTEATSRVKFTAAQKKRVRVSRHIQPADRSAVSLPGRWHVAYGLHGTGHPGWWNGPRKDRSVDCGGWYEQARTDVDDINRLHMPDLTINDADPDFLMGLSLVMSGTAW